MSMLPVLNYMTKDSSESLTVLDEDVPLFLSQMTNSGKMAEHLKDEIVRKCSTIIIISSSSITKPAITNEWGFFSEELRIPCSKKRISISTEMKKCHTKKKLLFVRTSHNMMLVTWCILLEEKKEV